MQTSRRPTVEGHATAVSVDRRRLLRAASVGLAGLGAASVGSLVAGAAAQPAGQSLGDQLNAPGPEARMLEGRVGQWDVTETFWPGPGAAPTTSTGLIAERAMMGTLLQEFIRPLADSAHAEVKRTDLLCYNRLEGRWDYLSFDTRAPVGLMPGYSAGRGELDRIEITFLPFAVVGIGVGGAGQMIRMRQEIVGQGASHDRKDQYFTLADGTGVEWLAHRYDYVRRS